ncbi:ATP-grasp domain-containing protein [Chitinophaga sp. sic0106]|uniref:ATP-grasp domain-containing protein n=1 Tax=Chitinophaga sp. sic0106 TaxID=2854785 RepID=UPI001C47746A|nr:ATP-grasp domain-containing protein [Chitinophaga sp. sic0106]MBV7533816.1 ATP-grasp domain-containing protein [Chitinophaga sp. sic0106]
MNKFSSIQWVVQRNLTSITDFNELAAACEKLEIPFVHVDIIPFTTTLPAIDTTRHSIIYGSTTFNRMAEQHAGLKKGYFFDPDRFSIENYMERWGAHMLNFGAEISSFRSLMENSSYAPEKQLFIRPNDDDKSFAGEVKYYSEIASWYTALTNLENTPLTPDTKIVVSEPYSIQSEWRLWIVNKNVVAASKYRQHFRLVKERGCPNAVIEFALARCAEYTPHDVFVMDVCYSGDAYYIVECGCLNGAGFYKANIEDIVKSVSSYFVQIL